MNPNRRTFSLQLAGLGLMLTGTARAQGAPVEGKDYVRLSQPAPVSLPPGKKIEVIEFFWYECIHCNAFEPILEPWVAKLPADVDFQRVPVGFSARHQVAQKLYYALQEMGLLDTALHRRIFAAVFVQGMRLTSEKDAIAMATSLGVDGAAFSAAYRSFSVNTKASKATQLSDAYKIDGTPALGIQGRYFTSGALAGTHERSLAVADFLMAKVRKSG